MLLPGGTRSGDASPAARPAMEPVSKSWNVATSQFCGGTGLGVCSPCPGVACMSVGRVPRACAARMCQRDRGLCAQSRSHAAGRSVAWSHLPSKAFFHREKYLSWRLQMSSEMCCQGSSKVWRGLTGSTIVTCVLSHTSVGN